MLSVSSMFSDAITSNDSSSNVRELLKSNQREISSDYSDCENHCCESIPTCASGFVSCCTTYGKGINNCRGSMSSNLAGLLANLNFAPKCVFK